jgi:hypothetical protein
MEKREATEHQRDGNVRQAHLAHARLAHVLLEATLHVHQEQLLLSDLDTEQTRQRVSR